MALRLVIDGYNYICASMSLSGSHPGRMDPVEERGALIEKLLIYKRLKRAKITVVFDGGRSSNIYRSRESHKGIDIVYSRSGEEADTIIKEKAKAQGKGLTIVTSDRELGSYCELHGAVIITSGEFYDLLEMALYSDMKGVEDDGGDDGQVPSEVGGRRKGPARKLSKKEREKRKKLKKL